MSGGPTPLTLDRTLVPGAVLRAGTVGAYRGIAGAPGEPHVVRTELPRGSQHRGLGAPRPLLVFAHATDLQLADVQSPARFEFCNQHVDDPRFHHLVPMHRPQELLVQGVGKVTEPLQRHLVGTSKPRGSLAGLDLDALENLFVEAPESFVSGQQEQVTADPDPGLHRELAGNEPWRGFGSAARGTVADRNAELRLRAPFPL